MSTSASRGRPQGSPVSGLDGESFVLQPAAASVSSTALPGRRRRGRRADTRYAFAATARRAAVSTSRHVGRAAKDWASACNEGCCVPLRFTASSTTRLASAKKHSSASTRPVSGSVVMGPSYQLSTTIPSPVLASTERWLRLASDPKIESWKARLRGVSRAAFAELGWAGAELFRALASSPTARSASGQDARYRYRRPGLAAAVRITRSAAGDLSADAGRSGGFSLRRRNAAVSETHCRAGRFSGASSGSYRCSVPEQSEECLTVRWNGQTLPGSGARTHRKGRQLPKVCSRHSSSLQWQAF